MVGLQVVRRRNELVLRLPENIFFASGDDSREGGRHAARSRRLATALRTRPVDIRVEGHTDDRPIRTARFRSNWELSTARATSVLVQLLDGGRHRARARSRRRATASSTPSRRNDTDQGRQQNRRVDLVESVHTARPRSPTTTRPPDAGADPRRRGAVAAPA